MPCNHRYLSLHRDDKFLLFPDWKIDYLFIGTFNPEWDNPNGNNADYFYGRSRYFWRMLCIFFTGEDNQPATREDKIAFAREHRIGFTDLFLGIPIANSESPDDQARIFSFLDNDLEAFGLLNLNSNVENIKDYLTNYAPQNVLFTLLSQNAGTIISHAISEIEEHAQLLNIPTARLHTPTGQGLGIGTPRAHKLLERWSAHNLLPQVDLALYPWA